MKFITVQALGRDGHIRSVLVNPRHVSFIEELNRELLSKTELAWLASDIAYVNLCMVKGTNILAIGTVAGMERILK
jgi:hypothetical protein